MGSSSCTPRGQPSSKRDAEGSGHTSRLAGEAQEQDEERDQGDGDEQVGEHHRASGVSVVTGYRCTR